MVVPAPAAVVVGGAPVVVLPAPAAVVVGGLPSHP